MVRVFGWNIVHDAGLGRYLVGRGIHERVRTRAPGRTILGQIEDARRLERSRSRMPPITDRAEDWFTELCRTLFATAAGFRGEGGKCGPQADADVPG